MLIYEVIDYFQIKTTKASSHNGNLVSFDFHFFPGDILKVIKEEKPHLTVRHYSIMETEYDNDPKFGIEIGDLNIESMLSNVKPKTKSAKIKMLEWKLQYG